MGRAKRSELSKELQTNLDHALTAFNCICKAYGLPVVLSDGYRRPQDNTATKNAAKASAHLECLAIDVKDADGKFWAWCIKNLEVFKQCGLYLEDKRWTPTWVHIQLRRPASGRRIFIPSVAPPIAPQAWDGKYDSRLDNL